MRRRSLFHLPLGAALSPLVGRAEAAGRSELLDEQPILVTVELSGGNDGLNSIIPIGNDDYFNARPKLAIGPQEALGLDADFGFNPGMLGLQRLWQEGQLAIVHGCGYGNPSFSHFTSMAYWHTAAPNSGSEFGWIGRVADALQSERRDNMIINVGSSQSLAVKSRLHTPVVFDDPNRFQRHRLGDIALHPVATEGNPNREFLRQVALSAGRSSMLVQEAWRNYQTLQCFRDRFCR